MNNELLIAATYPQFTNLKLKDGLVDQLMETIKTHVQGEYVAQRITAADYSKVFLGALEAVLTNSTQYLLGTVLLDMQKLELAAKIKLIGLESDKLQFEIDYLYPAQLIKLQQEGLLIDAQVRLADANVLKTTAEIEKIAAEILFLESQKLLIDSQILKTNAEILYIDAKVKTEKANTEHNFTSDSLIGRQAALLEAQKLGFSGDLYIKQAKIHADYAAVWQSVQEDPTVPKLLSTLDSACEPAKTIAGTISNIP